MLSRRAFIGATAAGGALGVTLSGPAFSAALGLPDSPFQYGVAAGDPLPDAIVIWTRVTPEPAATPGSGLGEAALVTWRVATDAAMLSVVASGTVTTSPTHDHTVKVDVTGLSPGTQYYYQFTALSADSAIGRARTAPSATATPARIRFGLVSCSNYPSGYFTPYRYLAARCDLDFVLHLGDYIYEYENGNFPAVPVPGRLHDPAHEIVTLEDYRRRHAIYKSDSDLQAAHASCAWITTIDDHEVTNDTWRSGAQNHNDPPEGDYLTRRNAAYQAYLEWMPIRTGAAPDSGFYRRFTFGTLADLLMLDLRTYRDQQVAFTDPLTVSPTRTMLGTAQRDWLLSHLAAPGPRWRLIGNSVQFMQIDWPPDVFSNTGFGSSRNTDAWDGYPAERAIVQTAIAQQSADYDAVFLTGDIHSTWAAELPVFAGAPPAPGYTPSAIEFVTTSVTSDNFDELAGAALSAAVQNALRATNRHLKLLDGDRHGCAVVEVTPAATSCDWYYTTSSLADPRRDPGATLVHGFARRTAFGSKAITEGSPIVDDCTPDPVIPEAPLPFLLPATAAAAVGALVAWRRRTEHTSA